MKSPEMPPFSLQVVRTSIRDLTYRRLAPGQSLSEEQLASLLHVSRTPLREAIQRLHAEGLIARADNGRIFMRKIKYEEAVHLYDVRSVLEQLAVEEAAERGTAARGLCAAASGPSEHFPELRARTNVLNCIRVCAIW